MQNPIGDRRHRQYTRERRLGQAATTLSLIISFAVFCLGLLSFEISRYFLATEQLHAIVQVAALTCEATLASSGKPSDSTNQSNAMTTALKLFQLNSILGRPLSNAALVSSDQSPTMTSGQADLTFQFLDPLTHQAITNTTPGSGAVVQATGVYGYKPSFSSLFRTSFAPMQIVTTAVSGVRELDLVVVFDISGGMDDETPVTFVQRYWNYDINNPPDRIVYMEPALDGNPTNPAGGPLGHIFCYTAPLVNALPPQSLQDGTDPTVVLCQQIFSGRLRGVGTTDSGTPPGNYVLPYVGDDTAPGMASTGGAALLNDLNNIAASVVAIDQWNPRTPAYAVLPYNLSRAPAEVSSGFPVNELDGWIIYALLQDGGTEGQVLEAINAGNNIAHILSPSNYWVNQYQFSVINKTPFYYTENGVILIGLTPQPPLTNYLGGAGPTASYTRYGLNYANGSVSSAIGNGTTLGNVIAPMGTAGTSNSNYTPQVTWGPSSSNTFTDVVVNLDGNNTFGGSTFNGFNFPTKGSLVEAARGNLDSGITVQQAGIDKDALGVNPHAGYRSAYLQAAALQVEPLMSVENALPGFLLEATQMGNTNLGFTAFNDTAGTSSTGTFNASNVSADYPAGGTADFPLPGITLGANNASTIGTALSTLTVGGNRNVAAAIQAALGQLSSSGRTGAQKAIVLITDGPPTVALNDDPNSTQAQSYSDARTQATYAFNAGVPIYCVAIYGDATTQSNETTIYNDTNNNSSTGGITAISGHGAKWYQLAYTTPSATQAALTQIFGNIIRQLGSVMH